MNHVIFTLMNKPKFLLIPSVSVWIENEFIIFDRKFFDGIKMYAKYWPGQIGCIMRVSHSQPPNFGLIYSKLCDLPFECIILNKKDNINNSHFDGVSIVMASADSYENINIHKFCKKLKIKCVYSIEYTPKTRYQISSLNSPNFLIKLRRFFFIWNTERKRKSAFSHADGIQANGIPAYNKYQVYKNTILYFDNRISELTVVSDSIIKERFNQLSKNEPLRLTFSGRLIKEKGAGQLTHLASVLKARKINFSLKIYGCGILYDEIKEQIRKKNLKNEVKLYKSVDFYKELIPILKSHTDLFIMLHKQGDPSCTYMETLLCGLPIVGYLNEAFTSLLNIANIGWGAEINNITKIVDIIEQLDTNREEIVKKSINSIEFSKGYNFESTFSQRTNHLLKLIQ